MWQRLPGPWPAKLLESALLVVGITAVLFIVVFPWLEPRLPFTEVTVDENQDGADTVDPANPQPSTTVVPTFVPAPAATPSAPTGGVLG
jgi:hypothetical protein